jgi:hypothetical protein
MSYVAHRHNRWYAVSYRGQDPLTGRERRRWHRADDEASARTLARTLSSSRCPRDPAHGVTVARFLRADWLPRRTRRLRPTTAHRYQQMAELYVIPRIGRVPLRRLTTGHLQRLYDQLLTAGAATAHHWPPRPC